ncbi:MAG: T9SS type A sorting domain-containing protein [Bacteroidota bacterium]
MYNTRILNGRALSLPQNFYALVQGFIMLGLLGFGTSLSAQTIEAYLNPTPVNTGDETEVYIEIGTESQPASNIHSFSATFVAEGFTMTAATNFDFDATGGWMLGSNFDFSYSINSAGTEITIDAWRNDQVGQSGYGLVGKGGNVTCEIDGEVGKKEAVLGFRLLNFSLNTREAFPLSIGPNPSSSYVMLENPTQEELGEIKLVDLSGKIVKTWNLEQATARLETSDIPNGLYFFVLEEKGVLRREKILIQH